MKSELPVAQKSCGGCKLVGAVRDEILPDGELRTMDMSRILAALGEVQRVTTNNAYENPIHEVLFDLTWGYTHWHAKQTITLQADIMDELNGSRGVFEWLFDQASLFQAHWMALSLEYRESGNYMEDVDAWLSDAVEKLAASVGSAQPHVERSMSVEQKISSDVFDETYLPQKNHIDENASWNGCMFETYGPEYAYVQEVYATTPGRVWTVLDSDGKLTVGSGLHHVNCLGYIITEIPCPDDVTIDVIDEDDEILGDEGNCDANLSARMLEIEPEDIEADEYTYFDCWTESGDEGGGLFDWDDSRAISIAWKLFDQWATSLGIPDIHPSVLRGNETFEHWYLTGGQHQEGYANAMRIVAEKIVQAGYSVYLSDTRLEIYKPPFN